MNMTYIKRFMEAAGHCEGIETANLYFTLVEEEYLELQEAWRFYTRSSVPTDKHKDLVQVLDAICDTIVTLQGLAEALGCDLAGAYAEVMRSNLSKIGADGKVHKAPNGKVIKPEGYSPPFLLPYVNSK